MGRVARLAVAGCGCGNASPGGDGHASLQRYSCASGGDEPFVHPTLRRLRPRSDARRPAVISCPLDAGEQLLASAIWSSPPTVMRQACVARSGPACWLRRRMSWLPSSDRGLAATGPSTTRSSRRLTIVYRIVVPAVRRGARAGTRLAPDRIATATASKLCGTRSKAAGRRGPVGRAARDRATGARGLPRRRPAGHAVQRASVRAGAHAARRAQEPGRRSRADGPCSHCRRGQAADRGGRERIAYRDLGVEQLGAVYETLLDYRPSRRNRTASPVELRTGSGSGKPPARFIRRNRSPNTSSAGRSDHSSTDAGPDRILQLQSRRPVDGQRRISRRRVPLSRRRVRNGARSQRAAAIRATSASPSVPLIRRTVAERCLYGVDLNPMAVQLARLSLWLTTLAGDRPLSFLDHRLQVGNSLLGAWLSALVARRRRSRHGDQRPRRPALRRIAIQRCVARSAAGALLARVDAQRHRGAGPRRRNARWPR